MSKVTSMSSEDGLKDGAAIQQELQTLQVIVKKQAERLQFVEQAMAATNSPLVVADMRQPNCPLVYVNAAFERLTGYPAAEIVGKNPRFLQNEDHDQPAIAEMRSAMSQGRNCTVVLRNYRKDGTLFWNEVTLSPIYDEFGKLTHFIGLQNDITGRKFAEESLRTTRDQLQAILDNSIAAIFLKDLSGCYLMANTRFYEMTDLSPSMNVEGKFDTDLYSPERAEAFHRDDEKVLRENRELEIEETFTRHDQQITHLTVKFPLRDADGQPYAIGGIATDISDRKRSEVELQTAFQRQQELNELKVRFVAMASHEFRTPLAAILATTETLTSYRHKMNDEEIEHRLQKIRFQVHHLRDIIDDVLQLTRIQTERAEFKPVEVNFDEFCREIVDEFQNQTNITHQFAYTCSEQLPPANIDKKLMRQALSNLLSNAMKYSPGGKTVWIDLSQDQDNFIVSVRDEGIGIPEDDIKHLFEAFHRATNVGIIPGTGLGLAILSQAVELHHGKIGLESEVGVGTTFTVSIPQNG